MDIIITTSVGNGETLLSCFDNALKNANVHNYNLIRLSSIIPPKSNVMIQSSYTHKLSEFGNKLYVVMAEMKSNMAGKHIAAGIGWYQLEDSRGFFVEHEVVGNTKIAVHSEITFLIHNSLKDMCSFRGVEFKEKNVKLVISSTKVMDKPTCALAIAVYKSEGWK